MISTDPRTVTARRRLLCVLLAAAGCVLIVAGSFLPWIASGSSLRSSHRVLGLIDRTWTAPWWATALIRAWPIVVAASVLPPLLALLRRRWPFLTLAITIGAFAALAAAAGAVVAFLGDSRSSLHGVLVGPLVTLLGAMTMIAATVLPRLLRNNPQATPPPAQWTPNTF